MGAVELIYDYFEDHVKAAALVNERRPLAFGILCFIIGGLSFFIAQALAHRLLIFSFSPISAAAALGWEVAAGFVLTAVLHLILEMEDIKGSAAGLFVLLGLADLSWGLAVPLILIGRLLAPDTPWVPALVFPVVGLIGLSLKARALQDNYRIGPGRAWLTLALPYMGLLMLILLGLALAAVGLVLQLLHSFH